ncbi:MAG: hypothetical protein GY827_07660 [Cytophagales bacterium]|nr:hypothetical protein [Cytophagales bacterium]
MKISEFLLKFSTNVTEAVEKANRTQGARNAEGALQPNVPKPMGPPDDPSPIPLEGSEIFFVVAVVVTIGVFLYYTYQTKEEDKLELELEKK